MSEETNETEVQEPEVVNKFDELIKYDVTQATIETLRNEFLQLTVKNVEDKEGYELCKKSRLQCRDLRVSVEKRRKELKADSLEFGRRVDARAKELMDPIKEIEDHLQEQQNVVDDELKRRKEEEEKKLRVQGEERLKDLASLGCMDYSLDDLSTMDDDLYKDVRERIQQRFEKQREEERFRAEREELGRTRFHKLAQLGNTSIEAETLSELPDHTFAELLEVEEQKYQERQAAKEKEAERLRQLEAENKAKEEENRKLREEAAKREEEERKRLAAEAEKERAAREAAEKKAEEERQAREAEEARLKAIDEENERKRLEREAAALEKVRDQEMFEAVQMSFGTVEDAWVEIARCWKLMATCEDLITSSSMDTFEELCRVSGLVLEHLREK